MPRFRRRRTKYDSDERFSPPEETDPAEVLRRLLSLAGPVESPREAEHPPNDDGKAHS